MFSWECTNFLKQQKQPPEVFRKKGVLKNFAIFTRKHLCWSLFGVFGVNFIKKRLQRRYFPVNITKFLRTPILKNIWDYVTIVHPAFCLFLYLTGVHFRGELQHGGDVSQQKISVDQSEPEK